MPISGIVITLENPDEAADRVRQAVASESRLSLGEAAGNQLPAVLETDSEAESEEMHEWLLTVPGIVNVDVVFVGFTEDSA